MGDVTGAGTPVFVSELVQAFTLWAEAAGFVVGLYACARYGSWDAGSLAWGRDGLSAVLIRGNRCCCRGAGEDCDSSCDVTSDSAMGDSEWL